MYNGLQHAHSGLRYVVLVLLILAIVNGWNAWKSGAAHNRRISLLALIFTHIQLLLGLGLYFHPENPYVNFSIPMGEIMSDSIRRFYSVEHISVMLIAIALITLGYSRAKRKADTVAKGKTTFIFYLIGLILILVSIPWPFRDLGGGWY